MGCTMPLPRPLASQSLTKPKHVCMKNFLSRYNTSQIFTSIHTIVACSVRWINANTACHSFHNDILFDIRLCQSFHGVENRWVVRDNGADLESKNARVWELCKRTCSPIFSTYSWIRQGFVQYLRCQIDREKDLVEFGGRVRRFCVDSSIRQLASRSITRLQSPTDKHADVIPWRFCQF